MEKKIEDQFLKILQETDLSHNEEYLKSRQKEYAFYKTLIKHIDHIEISKMEIDSNIPSEELIRELYFDKISLSERFFRPKRESLYWIKHKIYDFMELINYPEKKLNNLDFNFFLKSLQNNKEVRRMKLFLFAIIYHEKRPNYTKGFLEQADEFLRLASFGDCKFVISNLLDLFEKSYPELKTKYQHSAEGKSEQKLIIENVVEEDESEVEESLSLTTEEIKKIIQENKVLKDSLNEAQALTDFYRSSYKQKDKELHNFYQEAEIDMKLKVFQSMNSMQSNNTLDNFFMAKQMYDDLIRNNWTPEPPELSEILYVIQLFDAFLTSQMITPIHKIGEIISINLEDAKKFEYRGSEFKVDNETKMVKVKTPGWKYEDRIISKPSVVEVRKKPS